jgi:hypothetical protein
MEYHFNSFHVLSPKTGFEGVSELTSDSLRHPLYLSIGKSTGGI